MITHNHRSNSATPTHRLMEEWREWHRIRLTLSQLASTTIVSTLTWTRDCSQWWREEETLATPAFRRPSTLLTSYDDDSSHNPRKSTTHLLPRSASSKFYRRPIYDTSRMFHMPSCAFRLLLSRNYWVIYPWLAILHGRDVERGCLGSRRGRDGRELHPVRIWHRQPPRLLPHTSPTAATSFRRGDSTPWTQPRSPLSLPQQHYLAQPPTP